MPATTNDLHLYLLGRYRVQLGAATFDPLAWRLRKAGCLLALLALAPGHRRHRDQILEQFWPDHDPATAEVNFHRVLDVARRTLAPAPVPPDRFLCLERDWVALRPPGSLWIDVEAFEAAAQTARAAWQGGYYLPRKQVLAEALGAATG